MAFRRRVGNLAGTLLDNHLRRQQQEHQSELVKQRQLEVAGFNREQMAEQNRLQREQGEYLANLEAGHRDQSGRTFARLGEKFKHLVPSEDNIMGEIGSGFSSKAEELPTDVGIQSLLRNSARSDMAKDPRYITPLMTERDQKRDAILGGLKDTAETETRAKAVPGPIKSIDPRGTEMTEYKTPFQAAEDGPVQTGLSSQQNAQRTGAAAGASQRAQLSAEGAFYSSEEGQKLIRSKAQAHLAQATSAAEGAAIVKSAESAAKFYGNIDQLDKAWQRAQPEIERLASGGVLSDDVQALLEPFWDEKTGMVAARTIQSLPLTVQNMLGPEVRQYFEMRQSYMPIFARVLSEVGNLNEQEQLRAVGLAPGGLDAIDGGVSGAQKITRMKGLMVSAPDLMKALFAAKDLPPEQRMQIMDSILDQSIPEAPAPSPEAPSLGVGRQKLEILRRQNGRN